MSFEVLPPEVNSARMFSGVGSAPMLSAAGAWDSLASELGSAASSFSSLTSGLVDQAWQGPASAAMTAAAAPYAAWLSAAEAKASAAAAQATAVAGAFESALAATVHPLEVAINRNGLVQLVETNLFGLNAPAIAAVESQYEQMWAQDVAAMTGYHAGASAAASGLPQWEQTLQSLASAKPLQTLEQDLTPNVAISFNGQGFQLGSATATSGADDLAIAIGTGSSATASGGFANGAYAFGPLTTAGAGPGDDNVALALNSSGTEVFAGGNYNTAAAIGVPDSLIEVQGGNQQTLVATPYGDIPPIPSAG